MRRLFKPATLNDLLVALLCAVLSAIVSNGPVGASEDLLDGVPVRSIWETANFMDPRWLTTQPVFVQQETGYRGTSSFDAIKPGTEESIGLEMEWVITSIDDNRQALEEHFVLPNESRFLVTGAFSHAGATVETYSVVVMHDRMLTSTHLGYKDTSGNLVPEAADLATRVFSQLGIRGPFITQIIILPDASDEE